MDVGVRQAQYQLAVLASPTPFALPLAPVFAYQRLGEPERESLLADAARSLKQERLRQPAGGDGAYQPVSDPLVAIQGGDWHGGNVPVIRYSSSVVRRRVLRRRNLADFLGACAALSWCGWHTAAKTSPAASRK